MPLFPHFHRTYPPNEAVPGERTVWLLLQGRSILLQVDGGVRYPRGKDPLQQMARTGPPISLGHLDGSDYVMAEIAEDAVLDEGCEAADLRSLYGRVPETEWFIAGYAAQVAHWHRISAFCPVCASPMGALGAEWRRGCGNCGHERYPIVSPAVLALVHDGDRILLAHKPGWGARRSILAGFTLPGESLEECVHREVLEEAGVRIDALAYFGSQPWPFPQQLMIGFLAHYVSGAIEIDAEELEGAEWYHFRHLPALPPPLSLSRQMIDAWAQSRQGRTE